MSKMLSVKPKKTPQSYIISFSLESNHFNDIVFLPDINKLE